MHTFFPKISFFPFLKPYLKCAILSPIYVSIETLFELQLPLLMATIVDYGILRGEMSVIWDNGLLMLAILTLSLIAGMASGYTSAIVSYGFSMDLRNALYKHIMALPVAKAERFSSASLITRLTNDIGVMQEFMSSLLRVFVRAPIQFFGGIVMMFMLNIKFGIILLCTFPLQVLIIMWVIRRSNPLYEEIQSNLDVLNCVTQENVAGARTVKAYVGEEYEKKRFSTINEKASQSSYQVRIVLAILQPAVVFIMNISLIVLIIVGGFEVQARELQIGQIMAGITYLTQILFGLLMFSMVFPIYARANTSAKRINEVFEEDIEKNSTIEDSYTQDTCATQSHLFHEIEFKHIYFQYPHASRETSRETGSEQKGHPLDIEDHLTLEDISFTIRRGETLGILGATGSGKTSLINLLFRYYEPNSGEILIDGKNIQDYTLESLRSSIGFVSQKSELFSGTIWDNLRWGNASASTDEMLEATKIAQAHEYISEFSNQYDTLLGAKGLTLSGGQKQRLCIARALLKRPSLFIMDDATSALDLQTESIVHRALMQNKESMMHLIIAQRVASLQHADRILILEKGRLLACGSHKDLLQESTIYKEIYFSQNSDQA